MVRVEDANHHCENARRSGAKIVREPRDYPYGERQYNVQDFAGHHWCFSQCIAGVDPSEWGGTAGKHPYTDSMAVHLKPETESHPKNFPLAQVDPRMRSSKTMAGYSAELAQIRNPVLLAVLHGRRNPRVIAALLRGRD